MLKSLALSALCFAVALTGCTPPPKQPSIAVNKAKQTLPPLAFTPIHHKGKDPSLVAFYQEKSAVQHPYRIIGKERVSRFNFIGLQRQNETVNELMQKIAVSMGGDAIINITQDNQKVEGTVISFEKVLL